MNNKEDIKAALEEQIASLANLTRDELIMARGFILGIRAGEKNT